MKLNEVAIILQGYAVSKEQLEEVHDYYNDIGLKNIIISSYSDCIPDSMLGEDFVVNNDQILGRYDVDRLISGPNINYQILTTKAGIKAVKEKYPNVKYIMKNRADQEIVDLDIWIAKWIKLITKAKPPSHSPLTKKIVTLGRCRNEEKKKWYITDYWSFGLKEDMCLLWDIPLFKKGKYRPTRAEEYISSMFLKTNGRKWNARNQCEDYYILSPQTAIDNYSYKWDFYMTESTGALASCIK
tara:strand:- start:896 stop:1621 length:726 start_codon:yes stop_codon:yes gene_type:complete